MKYEIWNMKYQTIAHCSHFRHFSHFRHSTIITYFQKHLILTNKANFGDDMMIANPFTTRDYEENGHSGHQKTNPIKPNSNPISLGKKMLTDFIDQLFFRCSAGLPNSKALQTTLRAFSAWSSSTAQLMRISLVVIESILTLASAKAPNIFSATP